MFNFSNENHVYCTFVNSAHSTVVSFVAACPTSQETGLFYLRGSKRAHLSGMVDGFLSILFGSFFQDVLVVITIMIDWGQTHNYMTLGIVCIVHLYMYMFSHKLSTNLGFIATGK